MFKLGISKVLFFFVNFFRSAKSSANVQVIQVESAQTSGGLAQTTSSSHRGPEEQHGSREPRRVANK